MCASADLFNQLHDLYGAQAGASDWREAADGLVKRREVKLCFVTTPSALDYACAQLGADEAADLQAAYASGGAVLFCECLRVKRRAAAFTGLRVGTLSEVVASRLYPINYLTAMKALYV